LKNNKRRMKISYAITVCNEIEEIKKLISFLFKHIRAEDEIVVLYDNKNGDPKVWQYLNLIALTADNQFNRFKIEEGEFNNNFSEWKNYLNSFCTGDVIVNIDADEIPNETLINSLPEIIKNNSNIDLFWIPRINTVSGITLEHIKRWGWSINEKGWVNWPNDYQGRIYRNTSSIKWRNKVHEVLEGHTTYSYLPAIEEYALYHSKTIERQEKQNNMYNSL